MQYYTLEEAARLLGTTPDDVKKMAERNELCPFRDRGSMRFRSQEVEELARRLGRGSDAELQLGEGSQHGSSSKLGNSSKLEDSAGDVFDFDLPIEDDQVEIGQELNLPSGPTSSARSRKSKLKGPKSPPPKAGSDSDVRMVPGPGDLDFKLASDSDVKLVDDPGPKSSPSLGSGPKSSSRMSKPPSTRRDSSVRMVGMDDDSNVRLEGPTGRPSSLHKSPSDSDVRLEQGQPKKSKLGGKKPDELLLTEEIDLDAELKKAEEASAKKPGTKHKPGSAPQLPTTSPFELSESDLGLPEEKASGLKDSSSDFDLTPAVGQEESPLELGSDEMPAAPPQDDEVSLGELTGSSGESGINLRDPKDSGISLEQQGSEEEIEFELSLDEGAGNTPKPAPAAKQEEEVDSDSEFELSLEEPSLKEETPSDPDPSDSEFELSVEGSGEETPDSDSEFELTLDDEQKAADSDSEFELTLDDSGSMPAIEEEVGLEVPEGEKDIFETDFDVPALEDESGSQAMALDEESTEGDSESSDFDLDIGDVSVEDESGSQVLALDEDSEVDEGAATVARPRKQRGGAAVLDEDEAEELLEEGMDFETSPDGEPQTSGRALAAPAAEWGPMPAVVMGLCVVVMFVVGLMGFELIRGMYGYRQGGPVTSIIIEPIARMFTEDLPK